MKEINKLDDKYFDKKWISTEKRFPEIREKTYIALVKFRPTLWAKGPYSILQIDKSMTIEEVMEYMRWCSHWIPIKLI